MMRNTLPPLLQQLVAPTLQLRHDSLDASNLLDGLQSRVRELRHGVSGVIFYAPFELVQNFDGGTQLDYCRFAHGQTWMPCERLTASVRRCRGFR